MRRLPIVLHVVYKNDWSSAFLPGCAGVHLPTMTPRVKPPHTLVSVLHWLWYCRATALSALANLTLLLGKNTLPFPAFGNLNFVSPPHRRAYTSIPKSCPNIRFPHQQVFFPIRSVTKSSMARFSHENLVEKFKIFVQDFVPIRTALTEFLFPSQGWLVFKEKVIGSPSFLEHVSSSSARSKPWESVKIDSLCQAWGRVMKHLWFSMGLVTPHLYIYVGSYYFI